MLSRKLGSTIHLIYFLYFLSCRMGSPGSRALFFLIQVFVQPFFNFRFPVSLIRSQVFQDGVLDGPTSSGTDWRINRIGAAFNYS